MRLVWTSPDRERGRIGEEIGMGPLPENGSTRVEGVRFVEKRVGMCVRGGGGRGRVGSWRGRVKGILMWGVAGEKGSAQRERRGSESPDGGAGLWTAGGSSIHLRSIPEKYLNRVINWQ